MTMHEQQSNSPAYAYGETLGTLKRGMTAFAEAVIAGFQQGLKPTRELTPEGVEIRRILAHRARLHRERELGLAFVRSEGARARRELGL